MGMSESALETMILGAEAAPLGARTREPALTDKPHVRVEDLTGGLIRGVSFNMLRGEILGMSGVAGDGYEQVPYLLSGSDAPTGGSLAVGDQEFDLRKSSYVDLLAAGVALVPERRDALGLVGSCTIRENVTLPRVRSHNSRLLIKRDWERAEAEQVVNLLSVDTHDSEKLVGQLSGGNAQKILLGKWLLNQPDFLILHEPTQGVDVGARRDLLRALRAMADAGCCVLVVSGETEDLATMCDRILIIRNGVVGDELVGYRSPELIVAALYGEGDGQ
jgi:ribose transport system ATP-binding protein